MTVAITVAMIVTPRASVLASPACRPAMRRMARTGDSATGAPASRAMAGHRGWQGADGGGLIDDEQALAVRYALVGEGAQPGRVVR